MQKYRDRGTGGGGGHGRPTFSMDTNPACLRGIAPVLSAPLTSNYRLRGPCNTYTDYSKNKCYTFKLNRYTKDVIYIYL
jgi:hypothetical protein